MHRIFGQRLDQNKRFCRFAQKFSNSLILQIFSAVFFHRFLDQSKHLPPSTGAVHTRAPATTAQRQNHRDRCRQGIGGHGAGQ